MATVIRGSDNFDSSVKAGLGDGQTWQDVTASRVLATTYTNTTGRSIEVIVNVQAGALISHVRLSVDGVEVCRNGQGGSNANKNTVHCIVPNGSSYIANHISAMLNTWLELS